MADSLRLAARCLSTASIISSATIALLFLFPKVLSKSRLTLSGTLKFTVAMSHLVESFNNILYRPALAVNGAPVVSDPEGREGVPQR